MKQLELPTLAEGETYIGALGDQAGNLTHIILLPGDNDDNTWKKQLAWAKKQGGDLPTRLELSLMWANCRDQFKKDWYWSNEQHAAFSDYAWCQGFGHGYQSGSHTHDELRARAVRRLIIE